MKPSCFFTIAVTLFVLYSCKGTIEKSSEKVSVDTLFMINVDNPKEIIDLKLSELADSFRIIPLETNKDILLGQSSFYVSDDYILAFDQNGIYKFSADGDFIKKIINRGRGPQETSVFTTYFIDEKRDFMYVDDSQRDQKFLVYDVRNEKFLETINKCFRGKWNSFSIVNDSIILGTSNNHLDDHSIPYALFSQSLKGDFISGIPHNKKMLFGIDEQETFQFSSLMTGGNTFKISFNYNDTLFSIINNQLVPYLALNFSIPRDNPPSAIRKKGDRTIFFPGVQASGFILIRISITEDVIRVSEGAIKTESKSDYFIFNTSTGESAKVKSFMDDFLGRVQATDKEAIKFPTILPNGKLIVIYSPNDIKEAVTKGLNQQDFPISLYSRLLEINKTLTEIDNPVLLVGKIKNKL